MAKVNDLIAAGKLEDAADIVFDILLGALNQSAMKMKLSREEWAKVSPKLVAKMQNPESANPHEPTEDPGDDIDILDKTAQLVIKLVGPEGDEDFNAPAELVKNILVGATYNVVPPTVVGYSPERKVITGKMIEEGIEEIVSYTKDAEPVEETGVLEITYVGPEGDKDFVAPDAVMEEIPVAQEYMIISPTVEGYTPDKANVSGAMAAEGRSEVVTYSKDEVKPEE